MKVNEIHERDDSSSEDFIGAVNNNNQVAEEFVDDWTVDIDTNGTKIKYKLDTGAECNILPKEYKRLLPKPKLMYSPVTYLYHAVL